MSATAAQHLRAELTVAPEGAVRDALRWVGDMLGGPFALEAPATVGLVVSRIDTDAVVLRLTMDNTVEADFALDAVNRDLERMTVAQFIAEWKPRPSQQE
jgi:hypothetical protein